MALALDASSPTATHSANNTTRPITCTAFSPPAGSLIVVCWEGDDSGGSMSTPSITDSLGSHLTYGSPVQYSSRLDGTGHGQVAIWRANCPSNQTGMTITVTNNDSNATALDATLRIQVWTGADTDQSTAASGKGGGAAVTGTATYTSTRAGSIGVLGFADWNATASHPTQQSGCTEDAWGTLAGQSTGWVSRETSAIGSSGSSVTVGCSAPTVEGRFAYIEVLPSVAAASIPWAPQRSGQPRDPGETYWLQRDRRDANTVATAPNPLAPPLDSAWQAGSRYWHLYSDDGNTAPRTWQSLQRALRSDPSLLVPPPAGIPYVPPRTVPVRDPSGALWAQRGRAGGPPSRVYFVKTGGSNAADGLSDATAWATIAKVNATTLQPGDRVQFRGGDTFTGNVAPTTSGTASFPIVYTSYGTGRATISTTGTDAFSFVNVGGLEVRSLILVGDATAKGNGSAGVNGYATAGNGKRSYLLVDSCDSSSFSHGVIIGGDTTSEGFDAITLTNNVCHANRDDGIALWGGSGGTAFSNSNATITGNVCSGNLGDSTNVNPTGSGIVVGSTNTALIDQCTAHDNGGSNNAAGGPVGIWCYDSTAVTIQRCLSYSNKTAGTTDGGGFDLDINVSNSLVQYCLAYNNDGPGFMCFASGTSVFTGNTVRFNVSWGNVRNTGLSPTTYGEMLVAGTVASTAVYGNSFYAKDNASNNISAFIINATPTGVTIRNNIFQSQAAVTVLAGTAWTTGQALCQGNDYYRASGTQIKWGATTYATLAAWRAAVAGQEVVSAANTGFTTDPVFVDPTTTPTATDATTMTSVYTGLQLQGSSPLVTAGQDMLGTFGVDPGTRDFWGDALSVPLSIGADEFVAVSFDPTLDAWPWRWLAANRAALYADRRLVPQQRTYFDVSLLATAQLENELLGSADDLRRRRLEPAYYDRREVPQQRAYVSDPPLLATAELENELLGGAETPKRAAVPATHAPRWWMPRQPKRDATTPGLLDTAELENELLGGADTGRHYLAAAFYDRREVPQQRAYVSDPLLLVPAVPLDPTLAGWLPAWQEYTQAAIHVDRREVPQQRLYISDPSFYPTTAPTDPLTLAWGVGGTYWLLYATAALQVGRREVPQQRAYVSDPTLLTTAELENELLGGADDLRRHYLAAAYYDRREVPAQRAYFDPSLLATALLEGALLGGADTWRHGQVFTDRRQTVAPRAVFDPNGLTAPATDPLTLAAGVGGDLWRRYNTPAYADRRETADQPPRRTLYFDAGPGQPPLTLAYGAGGSWWHRIHWHRPDRSWWQPRPVFAALGNPCVVTRPSTGTTGRPSLGVTAYALATTARPSTGTTSRPDTGITQDPC